MLIQNMRELDLTKCVKNVIVNNTSLQHLHNQNLIFGLWLFWVEFSCFPTFSLPIMFEENPQLFFLLICFKGVSHCY